MKAMASPACSILGLLLLVSLCRCSAHRLFLESVGVHTHKGSSEATYSVKIGKAELLSRHNPFQEKLLTPHYTFQGEPIPPPNPFQRELLPLYHPLEGQSNVKNGELKPPADTDLELGLPGPVPPGSDFANTEAELGLPGPQPPGNALADTDVWFTMRPDTH